jgi:hypothetical protein
MVPVLRGADILPNALAAMQRDTRRSAAPAHPAARCQRRCLSTQHLTASSASSQVPTS